MSTRDEMTNPGRPEGPGSATQGAKVPDSTMSKPAKIGMWFGISVVIAGLIGLVVWAALRNKTTTSPSGLAPPPPTSPEGDDDDGGGGGGGGPSPSPSASSSPQSSPGPSSTPSPPTAPAPTAQSEYCEQRTDVTMAGGSGCKHYNDSRSKCLKHYQNPGGNDANAYGKGRLCKWNTGSDYPCKNNGESCEVATSPIIADFMENGDYCYGMENEQHGSTYTINKGTSDCSKFDKAKTTGAKQKCQTRFEYVNGNKSATGLTNLCSWSGDNTGQCEAKGKRCLRAVAPSGAASPQGAADD